MTPNGVDFSEILCTYNEWAHGRVIMRGQIHDLRLLYILYKGPSIEQYIVIPNLEGVTRV